MWLYTNDYQDVRLHCIYYNYSIDNAENVSTKLVVGNLEPVEEATCVNENISIQQQLPVIQEDEVDDAKSVTLRADKSHDMGIKEEKIDHSHHPASRDVTVSMTHLPHKQSPLLQRHQFIATGNIISYITAERIDLTYLSWSVYSIYWPVSLTYDCAYVGTQGEMNDYSCYSSSPDSNASTTVSSHPPYVQPSARQQYESTTISTGKCFSFKHTWVTQIHIIISVNT